MSKTLELTDSDLWLVLNGLGKVREDIQRTLHFLDQLDPLDPKHEHCDLRSLRAKARRCLELEQQCERLRHAQDSDET